MTHFSNTDEIKAEIKKLKPDSVFKFRIAVNANAKNNSIEFEEEYIKIRIKERAIEGKANKAIVGYFSELLDIPKSKIKIISGTNSKIKTIGISA